MQSSGTFSHVKHYEIVRPRRLELRQKRSLSDTQVYPNVVQYQLSIEGRDHIIHLEKNRNLIGKDFTETHYTEEGKRVTTSPHEEHCYYHGRIEGMSDSSVSVGICSGISGFVRAQQKLFLIEPLGESDESEHAVYQHTDSARPRNSSTSLYHLDQDPAPRLAGLFRSKSWKSRPSAEPERFVELFVVVDKAEYQRFGSQTKPRILGVVNHVDKVYRSINTRVILVGLEIWTNENLIDVDMSSESTLDHFLIWRQTDLLKRVKHDNAQFVTGIDFDGDTVGLANKFAMCTENSGGVNQDHHRDAIGLASTIAHEMGHNFGLSHDGPGCVCGPSLSTNCVMTDKLRTGSQSFPELFSSCSEDQLAEFLARARPSCLHKPPLSSRSVDIGPRCGNALLDPGEECDCGTEEECKNPCCDPTTCRLTFGSQCAHGRCCENCQFRAAGSMCRKASGECDLPEYCTGASEACPDDSFVMNGKPCYDQAPGYCHNGQCPTHQQHCWRLFGRGAKVGHDACFDLNSQGQEGANCGTSAHGYTSCTSNNLRCGSIFCEDGGDSITGKRAVFTVRFLIKCNIAVDDDKSRNIDMTPNGTKCGTNKVCLDNKCQDLSVYGATDDCNKKCNNHGVCNHKKECHCDPGWAPPHCNVQYADLPQGQTAVIAGVCTAVLIVLLISALVTGLICYKKDRPSSYISKRKVHSALEKQNPMFDKPSVKPRPEISQPTLMESTAAQVCTPLFSVPPSRPAPPPPKKSPPEHPDSHSEMSKPLPPSKPLPSLSKTEFKAKPSPPPVPSGKPRPPVAQKKSKEKCDGFVLTRDQH